MKDNVTDIAFTQGRLMQVILTQIQMLNAGLTVPHFLKEQETELNLLLDNMKEVHNAY